MRRRCYGIWRIAVAAILLTSAGLKGHQLATEPVAGTSLIESRPALIAVVEVELLLSIWLATNVYPRAAWLTTTMCFVTFACVSGYKGMIGAESCGCFGTISVSPWWTFGLDVLVLGGMVMFGREATENTSVSRSPSPSTPLSASGAMGQGFLLGPRVAHRVEPRLVIANALFLLTAVPAGWVMATYRPAELDASGFIEGDGPLVVLEPTDWIGKKFPLASHIEDGQRLSSGRWLVVLYHHDCPKCQEVLPEYHQLLARSGRVALVEIPPYGDMGSPGLDAGSSKMDFELVRFELKSTSDEVFLASGPSPVSLRLSDAREWFVQTPVEIVLEEGIVKAASDELDALQAASAGGDSMSLAFLSPESNDDTEAKRQP